MKGRRIHIILASVLFGVLVWLSAVMREQFQATVSVPLSIENIPQGSAVSSPVPRQLELKVRGDGWQLALLMLGSHPTLTFSWPSLQGRHRAISYNDVLDRIALRPGIQLTNMEPDSVYIELERSVEKKVPVIPDLTVSFREGYGQVGPITVVPETVAIAGAESVLRDIHAWKTAHTTFSELTAPVTADVPLAAPASYLLALTPPKVRIGIQVDLFAERTFSGLPVEILSVPANREVVLLPPRIEVVVRTGIRQLSALTPGDFRITVDYGSVANDAAGTTEPVVTAPAGIQVVSKHPGRLEYVIRKRM